MNKKQFGIIFTLLGLIICVGLLATKLNEGGLNDPTDLSQVLSTNDDEESKDAETIANLKAIIEDGNTSKDQKTSAQKQLLEKTKQKDNENRVEINIKNKGVKDALCTIDGTKAKVFVKTDGIDEKMSLQIQEIVQDVANINDISIEVKK